VPEVALEVEAVELDGHPLVEGLAQHFLVEREWTRLRVSERHFELGTDRRGAPTECRLLEKLLQDDQTATQSITEALVVLGDELLAIDLETHD
jgi:hypothetical protein